MHYIYYIILLLLIIPSTNYLHADTDYYRYVHGEQINMIIDDQYIIVEINPDDFNGWSDLYANVQSLDITEQPFMLRNDIYRLKSSKLVEIQILIDNLFNITGIVDAYPSFVTTDSVRYFIYRRLGVIFNNEIFDNTIDSVISANALNIIYHSIKQPNVYIFDSPDIKAIQCLFLANNLIENGFAIESSVDIFYPISLFGAPDDYYYEEDQYYLHPEYTDFETAYDYVLTDSIVEIAILDIGIGSGWPIR